MPKSPVPAARWPWPAKVAPQRSNLRSLQARLAADPADHQARYDLATALNASDEREQAAEALLEILRRNRSWNEARHACNC